MFNGVKKIILPVLGIILFLAGAFYLISEISPICVDEKGYKNYMMEDFIKGAKVILLGTVLWIGWMMSKPVVNIIKKLK